MAVNLSIFPHFQLLVTLCLNMKLDLSPKALSHPSLLVFRL